MVSWLPKRFGLHRKNDAISRANVTFGQTTFSRTVRSTGAFLRQQFWIWPIIAIFALSGLGYIVNSSIRQSIENSLKVELQTLLQAQKFMLQKWLEHQESNALAIASQHEVRSTVEKLVALDEAYSQGTGVAGAGLTEATPVSREEKELASNRLRQLLMPGMSAHRFAGYIVVDREQKILSASSPELIGKVIPQNREWVRKTTDGETTVSVPTPSAVMLRDRHGEMRAEVPTMFAAAPVRNEDFQAIATLAFRIRPEREFTEILSLGETGKTGETYAFDKNGLLVSNSRFDEQLMLAGLIPDREGSASILNVQLRDPGGNLLNGFRPKVRRIELPLTYAVNSALLGDTGLSIDGHRNYRGIPSVSAWTWFPKYELGVITEREFSEAFRPLTILRWVFAVLFSLLVLTSIAIFIFSLVVARVRQEARKSAIEAKKLGQYRLDVLLGTGAMGVVYKGHHAMLRRPTAIKLLKSENVSAAAIERFENEVQITCQLNNPHTVAIYDYGRTPEGVFYYAMEFLDGINLQSLVEAYGPQPADRVIQIMQQICGSLYEAHTLGLVHRDIKPANIMLNRRGGVCDVVKVLDFGLVRSLDEDAEEDGKHGMTGTPMYMSPEAIQNPRTVDVRSDIYSLGALGYFLLTGQPLYEARSLSELFQKHIDSIPDLPSERSGNEIPAALENAIMACLEKNRANRPQTAKELSDRLENAEVVEPWSRADAEAWWSEHEREEHRNRERDEMDGSILSKGPQTRSRISSEHASGTKPNDGPNSSKTKTSTSAKTLHEFEATMPHQPEPEE